MAPTKVNPDNRGERRTGWRNKLRDKYRLVILNEDTFEEKLSFKLSRLNVFVVAGTIAIILIFFTTYLIAFTPLREFIPGYGGTTVSREYYDLQLRVDSLGDALANRDLYIRNIRAVISGEEVETIDQRLLPGDSVRNANAGEVSYRRSREDSLLRAEYERENRYTLSTEPLTQVKRDVPLGKINFYTPVKGIITNRFNASGNHYGIDIAAKRGDAVKAAYDGIVFFSEWTAETGHVIAVQHTGGIVTVYKHNSVLLRRQGSFVRAAESIAIIGSTGEYTTGPHLHFELWINSTPVDPEKYLTF